MPGFEKVHPVFHAFLESHIEDLASAGIPAKIELISFDIIIDSYKINETVNGSEITGVFTNENVLSINKENVPNQYSLKPSERSDDYLAQNLIDYAVSRDIACITVTQLFDELQKIEAKKMTADELAQKLHDTKGLYVDNRNPSKPTAMKSLKPFQSAY